MNENKKIAFLTAAYNGEKTLQRTIDSIKAQTHQNFEYFILNDGSGDGTQAIIDENCRLDIRIHSIYFSENDCQEHFIAAIKEILKRDDFDFFAICDHDDEYLPTFAEKTIEAALRTGAEAAFCNIYYNSKVYGDRNNRYFDGEQFLSTLYDFANAYAPYLCSFMRTQWGKLFSISAIRKTDPGVIKILKYGRDTLFCNEIIKNCSSVVLLEEPLYRFYMSPETETSRVEKDRIGAPAKLYFCAESFIKTKCGEYGYMCESFVYMNYLSDLYSVTNQTANDKNLSDSEKIDFLISLYSDPIFEKAYKYPHINEIAGVLSGQKLTFERVVDNAAQVCLSLFSSASEEQLQKFAEIATLTAVLAGYKNPMIPEMGKGPKAVILTLCHNSGEELRETVQSVLSQTYWNFDYFLADNASTDNTRDIILEIEQSDSRVHHIFYDTNKFPDVYVELIPKVLENAEYKYFAICDHDDSLYPKFLETAIKTAKTDDAEIVFGGNHFVNKKTGKTEEFAIPEKLIIDTPQSYEQNLWYFTLFCAWFGILFSTDLVNKTDLSSNKSLVRSHDIIFTLDALEKSKRSVLLPEIFYRHNQNENSASTLPDKRNINSIKAQLDKSVEVYKKRATQNNENFNLYYKKICANLFRDLIQALIDLLGYEINKDSLSLLLGYLDTPIFYDILIKYSDKTLKNVFIKLASKIVENKEKYRAVCDEKQKERFDFLCNTLENELKKLNT
jgi:glycosyltransferase involved in cell wall biosynthesis